MVSFLIFKIYFTVFLFLLQFSLNIKVFNVISYKQGSSVSGASSSEEASLVTS